jgi:hypothetical protein
MKQAKISFNIIIFIFYLLLKINKMNSKIIKIIQTKTINEMFLLFSKNKIKTTFILQEKTCLYSFETLINI